MSAITTSPELSAPLAASDGVPAWPLYLLRRQFLVARGDRWW